MYLTHLSLTNFRNFARLDVDVPQGAVLLLGDNAQGKTSLLEAIYYLATFTSFHAHSDRQLINFIAAREALAVARIVADFCRMDAVSGSRLHHLEVRIIQEAGGLNHDLTLRKEVLLDGNKGKVSESVGYLNAVLFLPQTLRVIEGSPEERRRYINLTLSQVLPRYAYFLGEYNKSLAQRNALLKQINERGGDQEQLQYWDEQLANSGSQIMVARIHAIHELERHAIQIHAQLTHGAEVLRLSYEPAYDPLPQPARQYALPLNEPIDRTGVSIEKIQQGFLAALVGLRKEEIVRGLTTIGPQRDDLRFLTNGIDLGIFGSRGQARTAMLALKLAEVAWMKEKTGQWPVLLLDEVLAELDQRRRTDLLTRLSKTEQNLLTTTDLDLFSPDFVKGATRWQIQAGRLEKVG
jgi:DNA replication and repair protein RecF